ncbi:MAG: 50S ribosomal protein L17 [SAR324 cluster bacterium]|nr:50S ribosomal protein L17 [SAR324 cluster bacterium]MBL7034219.1 50S ribosomal protein L17 [SAR324 cluster bacterium]
MRHLKAGNRLGVTTAHRRAMMRNMVTSILEHGQITCTLARAKEVRKPLEKMISWGKQGDLHARRQALRFIKSKEAMAQLFEGLAERYKDRQGGYCRIIKLGKNRLGDNSEMAIVQLLGSEGDQLSGLKTKSAKKKKSQKKTGSVLKEVSEEIQIETVAAEQTETESATTDEKSETDNKAELAADTAPVQQPVEDKPAGNVKVEVDSANNEEVKTEAEATKAEVEPVTEPNPAAVQDNRSTQATEQEEPEVKKATNSSSN